jgi:hypothetical protein
LTTDQELDKALQAVLVAQKLLSQLPGVGRTGGTRASVGKVVDCGRYSPSRPVRVRSPGWPVDTRRREAAVMRAVADRLGKEVKPWAGKRSRGALATEATSSVPNPLVSTMTAVQEARGPRMGISRAARWRKNKALQKSKGEGKTASVAAAVVAAIAPVQGA